MRVSCGSAAGSGYLTRPCHGSSLSTRPRQIRASQNAPDGLSKAVALPLMLPREVGDADLHRRTRCHGLTAPCIVDAPMNSRTFETWIETQLAPTLSPGEVVILDNVGFHKNERAQQLSKAKGASLLFLPPYSPALIRSKWHSQNSRFSCGSELFQASIQSPKPSATSSAFSPSQSAEISSRPHAMRPNKCDTLYKVRLLSVIFEAP